MCMNYSPILAQSKYHKRKTWKKLHVSSSAYTIRTPWLLFTQWPYCYALTIDLLCKGTAGMLGNSVLLVGRRGAEN